MIWMLLIFTISNCGFTLARKYSTEKTNFHILSLVVKINLLSGHLFIKQTKITDLVDFRSNIYGRKLGDQTEMIQNWRFESKIYQFLTKKKEC